MIHNLGFVTNGWKSRAFSALSGKTPGTAAPSLTSFRDNGAGSTGVYVMAFDDALEESVYFSTAAPSDMDWTVGFYFAIEWSAPTTDTAQVCWGVESSVSHGRDPYATTNLYYQDEHDGPSPTTITQYGYHRSLFGPVPMSLWVDDFNSLIFRVFRDATSSGGTDDYTDDAYLINFVAWYYTRSHALPQMPM